MVGIAPDDGAADIGFLEVLAVVGDGAGLAFAADLGNSFAGLLDFPVAEFGDENGLVRVLPVNAREGLIDPDVGFVAILLVAVAVDGDDVVGAVGVQVRIGPEPSIGGVKGESGGVEAACQGDQFGVDFAHFGEFLVTLVADRPEDNGRMVAVAPNHGFHLAAAGSEDKFAFFGVVTSARTGQPVGIVERNFTHNEQAQFVAHVNFAGIVGIAAETNEVGAHAFHVEQVAAGGFEIAGHARPG